MARRKDLPPIKTEKQKAEEDRVRWLSYAPDIAKFFRESLVENNGRMARADLLRKLDAHCPDWHDAFTHIEISASSEFGHGKYREECEGALDDIYQDIKKGCYKGVPIYALVRPSSPVIPEEESQKEKELPIETASPA